ncbi:MAG: hypothetical protein CM15mP55_3670 [Hyphomicrobiales bacterium]|nr:MAG: hypothetical protein CM15mP55_3670 [Hyphomicrobiales bacterium]
MDEARYVFLRDGLSELQGRPIANLYEALVQINFGAQRACGSFAHC